MIAAVTVIREDEVEPEVWLFESAEAARRFAAAIASLPVNLLIEAHMPDQVLDGSQVDGAVAAFAASLEISKWDDLEIRLTCHGGHVREVSPG